MYQWKLVAEGKKRESITVIVGLIIKPEEREGKVTIKYLTVDE